MNLLMVQHSASAPPGYLGERVLARGGRFDVFHPALAYADHRPLDVTRLPQDDTGYDGLVILGGPMDAFDDDGFPHFRDLFALIGVFERAGKPVLGLCLGAQLIARSHGGTVRRQGWTEAGLTDVALLPGADTDPVLAGLPPRPLLMEWHQDTFDLPADATLLVTGRDCPNQIFRAGAATYACQGHPEATLDSVRQWVYAGRTNLPPAQRPDLPQIVARLNARWQEARPFADALLDRWLDLCTNEKSGDTR